MPVGRGRSEIEPSRYRRDSRTQTARQDGRTSGTRVTSPRDADVARSASRDHVTLQLTSRDHYICRAYS